MHDGPPNTLESHTNVVLALDAAAAWADAQRAAGRRIVFSNGVFDVLHVGHVRMLREAATHGDVLVVAVNGDAHARATRGPGRPVVPARERVELVASLVGVTAAFVFEDRTVDTLLKTLRPHVHAKGRDYTLDSLPERESNKQLGIDVVFVGDEKSHSSSALASALHAPPPDLRGDRIRERSVGAWTAYVHDQAIPYLQSHGWDSWDRWAKTDEGEHVEGEGRRVVHRIRLGDKTVYLKRTRPLDRKRSPLIEFQHTLAVRAAGFGAPKPWICMEGKLDGERMGVLVTEEVPGVPLDIWLQQDAEQGASIHGRHVAVRLGRVLRGLHTARLFPRDLQAWHIFVDDGPAFDQPRFWIIDLMRLERGAERVSRRQAVKGIAPLALSIEHIAAPRFRLSVLRGYLGGGLKAARPWFRDLTKRMERLRQRGSFQPAALQRQLDANRARHP